MDILSYGSTGPQVELLQAGLNRAGINIGIPDGIFGNLTRIALQKFQVMNGIVADGILGPLSYQALYPYLSGYFTHQIVAGDTLFRLANTYKTTTKAIEIANPDINPYFLNIGSFVIIPLSTPVVFTDISFSFEVLELTIKGLKARYPFLSVESIGQSFRRRNIYAISIGKGDNHVFYNASHHANEWITTPLLMKFIEDYAFSYSHGGDLVFADTSEMYNKTTIYLVPMVNPDGVNLAVGQTKVNSAEYNIAASLNPSVPLDVKQWKANLRGVDLNLNYPAEWKKARDYKFSIGYTRPGPRDYVGPNPLSEPESQAIALFTLKNFFRLTISYHTQGEVIFWKFLDFLPEGSLEIAKRFRDVSGYALEITPTESGYAGYKDWFIQTYNLPGYTVEAGSGVNPLPISQFEKIYADNLGILLLGAIL